MGVLTYIIIARIANAVQCHFLMHWNRLECLMSLRWHAWLAKLFVVWRNIACAANLKSCQCCANVCDVWGLKNIHICLICQCSVEIFSYQGALWAPICGICCKLCLRWWQAWGWSQWYLGTQHLPQAPYVPQCHWMWYFTLWRLQNS